MMKRVALERFYREASVVGRQTRVAERKRTQNKGKMASERRTEQGFVRLRQVPPVIADAVLWDRWRSVS